LHPKILKKLAISFNISRNKGIKPVILILWEKQIGYQTFIFYKTQSILADVSLIEQLKRSGNNQNVSRNCMTGKKLFMKAARRCMCACPGSCKKQNVSRKCMTGKKLFTEAARRGIVCLPGPILQGEGAGVGGNVQVTGRPRPTWTSLSFND
jgi:hypothetical protein